MLLAIDIKVLNSIEVLTSKSLIDSFFNHEEFVSVNNVLREFNKMNKEIKNPKNAMEKQWNILCQL